MRVFGTSEVGCFGLVRTVNPEPATAGAVLQIISSDGGQLLLPDTAKTAGSSPFVIVGFSLDANEQVSFQTAFGDNIYAYAFGMNVGVLTVEVLAFLGTSKESSASLQTILDAYDKGRISRSRASSVLSFGSEGTLKGPIIGMSGGTQDVNTGIHRFTLKMAVVQPLTGDTKNTGSGSSSGSGGGSSDNWTGPRSSKGIPQYPYRPASPRPGPGQPDFSNL